MKKITVYDKAQEIAQNGMNKKEVFKFFSKMNKDIIAYIALFSCFGVDQNTIWDLYEQWQSE